VIAGRDVDAMRPGVPVAVDGAAVAYPIDFRQFTVADSYKDTDA
jgi:hypothetical protein